MDMRNRLFPDEFLRGFRGHVCFHNNLRDAEDTNAALNSGREFGETKLMSRSESLVKLVSDHTGTSVHEIVCRHTLWPFTACMRRVSGAAAIEAYMGSSYGRTDLMRKTRQFAWTCHECQREDLAFWGETFWRCSHQLPGQMWCHKHGTALAKTSLGHIDFGPPDHFDSYPPEDIDIDELKAHLRITEYSSLCAAILDGGLTFSPSQCAARIVRQAERIGLGTNLKECADGVLQQVPIVYPRAWLADLDRRYPNIRGGQKGGASTFLEGKSDLAGAQLVMLLALAVFETASEALVELRRTDKSEETEAEAYV
jgi:hypothetical protein